MATASVIVPEPDLRLGERHHAVRIVGVQLHRALRGLKPAGIVGLKREPETDDLIAKAEIRIEAHGLPRFAEAQVQFRRGGLTAGPLRDLGDIGQRKARAGGRIGRVHFQGALVQGTRFQNGVLVAGAMPVTVTRPQHKIIGLQIVCRPLRRRRRFAPADIGRKLGDDFRGEFALDGENVGDLPVKAARP